MIEKLKELYDNLDLDYDRMQLYFKNCTEKEDWYYNELLYMYIHKAELPSTTSEEECHGIHKYKEYTSDSVDKFLSFKNKLNILLNDFGNLDSYNIDSN